MSSDCDWLDLLLILQAHLHVCPFTQSQNFLRRSRRALSYPQTHSTAKSNSSHSSTADFSQSLPPVFAMLKRCDRLRASEIPFLAHIKRGCCDRFVRRLAYEYEEGCDATSKSDLQGG